MSHSDQTPEGKLTEDVQLDVELEKRIAEIRKRLSKVAEGPWFTSSDDASDSPDHKDSGLAMVDTGRSLEWPIARLCEWQNARFIEHAILDIPFLLEQLALLRRVSAPEVVFEFSPSPCGHSSQYAYTEDGGKNIVCLVCELRVSGKGAQEQGDNMLQDGPANNLHQALAKAYEWNESRRPSPAPVPATPEISVAVEREQCCKDVCACCGGRDPRKFLPAEFIKGRWWHRLDNPTRKALKNKLFKCYANTIRNRATTQGTPEGAR